MSERPHERVAAFADRWTGRQRDDTIYGIDIGEPGEVELTRSDLISMCEERAVMIALLAEAHKWIDGGPARASSVYDTNFGILAAIEAAITA